MIMLSLTEAQLEAVLNAVSNAYVSIAGRDLRTTALANAHARLVRAAREQTSPPSRAAVLKSSMKQQYKDALLALWR